MADGRPSFDARTSLERTSTQINGHAAQQVSSDDQAVVPVGFDETVLRHLTELDVRAQNTLWLTHFQCGLPLMLDRIKQDATACAQLMTFLRKRAILEDEYGRSSIKLARATQEAYRDSDGKAGSFVTAYQSILKAHESLGENRVRFAQQMNEMADQLGELQKEVELKRLDREIERRRATELSKAKVETGLANNLNI